MKNKAKLISMACALALVSGVAGVANTVDAKAEAVTLICDGAGIRLARNANEKSGIRFRISASKTDYETLVNDGKQVYVLVMPTDLIGADGELTVADVTEDDTGATVEALRSTNWETYKNNDGTEDETKMQAYAYVYGMTEAEYNRSVTWRAYYLDGETPVYSDADERCISEVALLAEKDEMQKEEAEQDTAYLEKLSAYLLDYDVSFNYGYRENGEWKTETQKVRYGSYATAEEVERDGFAFGGWDGYDFTNAITGTEEVNAKWTLNSNLFLNTTSDETVASYPAEILTRSNDGSAVIATQAYEYSVTEDTSFNKNVLSISTKSTWQGTKAQASMEFYPITVPAGAKVYIKASVATTTGTGGADLYVNGVFKDTFKINNTYQYGVYKTFTIDFEDDTTLSSISFRPYIDTARYTFNIATFDIITDLTDIDFDKSEAYGSFISGSTYTLGFAEDEDYGTLFTATSTKSTNDLNVKYNNLVLPVGTTVKVRLKWSHTDTQVGGAIKMYINGVQTSAWMNKPDQWWEYSTTLSEETTLSKITFDLSVDRPIIMYLDYITITYPTV